ncbi:YbjN domain-containing protein, partial [Mycobacterium tuberculosis]
ARSAMRRSWAVRSSPTTMQSAQRDEKELGG